ncbi:MAG: hypothetical protein RLZZ165_1038 [Bacteroidota bacterium]|jgi:hypothetical protein
MVNLGIAEQQMESTEGGKAGRVNPWLAIWFQTRKALLFAWRHIPEEYVHRLYMASGLVFMLGVRIPDWLFVTPNPVGVMIQVLLVGPVGGIVAGYLYSACLRMVGKWFGRDVPSIFTKCTVAWSQLPFAAFWAAFLATYFLLDPYQSSLHPDGIWLFQGTLGWLPVLLPAPLLIWAVAIRIRSIGLLLGFHAGRAFLIWLMTVGIAYVPALAAIYTYLTLFYATASGRV